MVCDTLDWVTLDTLPDLLFSIILIALMVTMFAPAAVFDVSLVESSFLSPVLLQRSVKWFFN